MTEQDWLTGDDKAVGNMVVWLQDRFPPGSLLDETATWKGPQIPQLTRSLSYRIATFLYSHSFRVEERDPVLPLPADAAAKDPWSVSAWLLLTTDRPAHMGLADILRDVVGNPFRPVLLKDVEAHLSPAVQAVARSIYEERRLEELPVLADTLEEAGCQNATLLEHLRSKGPHTWACWALALARRASAPPPYAVREIDTADRVREENASRFRTQHS